MASNSVTGAATVPQMLVLMLWGAAAASADIPFPRVLFAASLLFSLSTMPSLLSQTLQCITTLSLCCVQAITAHAPAVITIALQPPATATVLTIIITLAIAVLIIARVCVAQCMLALRRCTIHCSPACPVAAGATGRVAHNGLKFHFHDRTRCVRHAFPAAPVCLEQRSQLRQVNQALHVTHVLCVTCKRRTPGQCRVHVVQAVKLTALSQKTPGRLVLEVRTAEAQVQHVLGTKVHERIHSQGKP